MSDVFLCYTLNMEKSCGIILYTNIKGKRHYLLIQDKKGRIGFPKGHIEEGETEKECALRETWEETSLVPSIIPHFYKSVQYRLPNGTMKRVAYYLGYFEDHLPAHQDGFEHFDYLLLTYKEALAVLKYKNNKDVLIEAESFLNQGWSFSL